MVSALDKMDLKDVCQMPVLGEATVTFSGGKVETGSVTTPTNVQDPPKVTFKGEPGKFYTLLKTDPDAPSRQDPKWGEWHHWLVVNIPGSDVEKGDTVYEYVGAGPPEGSGLHRYFYLVFEQPGKIDYKGVVLTNKSGDGRGCQKAAEIIKKYGLVKLVGACGYSAEFDSYVPILYKKLGF